MIQKNGIVCISDEDIIELYFARDERAIKETDKKYNNYLISVAYAILHNNSDSEECLNDTYIGAWNAIPPARPRVLLAFLSEIMRRIAINRYKSDRRKKRIPPEIIDPLPELEGFLADAEDIYSDIEAKELGESINAYIKTLSKRRRYIFMSRYYYLRKIDDIAKVLSLSPSTVSKEIFAIKDGLRKKLESEGYTI